MAAASLKNPDITPVEAYRIGLKTVRDALGENIHLLNVSATGPSIGIADSVRITLDNMPIWDGKSQNLYDMANQGIKPTYVTAARRYYYNQNVWINHPDLIFFRKVPDDKYPALTLNESKAFISFVGITGGIVKIGEKLVEMEPEWIDSVRRVLPVHPIRIRPFDLFLREFPEIWYGKVTDVAIPDYFILGVFNWGKNRDLTTNPYIDIEDRSRDYFINFSDLGIERKEEYLVYEFWDEKFYGVYQDSFNVNIPPHRAMVFSLRKKSDIPQLIGTNRHILMGAEEVSEYHFDNEKNILTLRMTLAQSLNPQTRFEHRFYFYVPDDYDFLRMENTNDKIIANSNLNKNILLIKMIPEKTSENLMKLYFLKK
jgi:alpha-galactosidase